MKYPMIVVAAALSCGAAAPASVAEATPGVVSLVMVDDSRGDPVRPDEPRRWSVRVYYPAVARADARPEPYLPDTRLAEAMIADGYYDVPAAELKAWTERPGPAIADLPAAAGARPLLTLSPGMGVAGANYADLAAAFVRRGYVVAVVNHPYVGVDRLPDGQVRRTGDDPALAGQKPDAIAPRIRDWTRDLSVVIDRLTDPAAPATRRVGLRIDPARIAAAGHSVGGTAVLDLCGADKRVRACMDFEGAPMGSQAMTAGAGGPTLLTLSRTRPTDADLAARGQTREQFQARGAQLQADVLETLGKGGDRHSWVVAVSGGGHMSFSDFPAVAPQTLSRFGGELMSAERSQALYVGMAAAFAEAYWPGGGRDTAFEAWLRANPETAGKKTG